MTTFLVITAVEMVVFAIFCLALCKTSIQPMPGQGIRIPPFSSLTTTSVFSTWRAYPEVPVLLITGFCDDIEAAKQLLNDVHGASLKPFHLGGLIGKVREIVSFA